MQPGTIIPAPNLFPSANVVYVDNDYLKLRGKGLLAYGTLEDAVISWRAGGAARNKYGTPSATNPAAIVCGVGEIECLSVGSSTCVIDVDFLHVRGQGMELTVLTSSAVSIGNMVQFNTAGYILKDLTIKAPSNASRALVQASATFSAYWEYIRVRGNPTTTLVLATTSFEGRVSNCVFDGESVTTAIPLFTMAGGSTGAFVSCFFRPGPTQTIALSMTADFQGKIQNCEFRGNVSLALINSTGGSGGFGVISGCYFESETTATSFRCTTNAGFAFVGCSFLSEGKAISIVSTTRTKFVNCNIIALVGNNDCIELLTGSTFFNVSNCRILGSGTGLAINSVDVINANITNCTLKMPTGDVVGSSVSSNITNIAAGGGSSNEEILNSQQY